MNAATNTAHDLDEDTTPVLSLETLTWLDEQDEAETPEGQREYLRKLGAPPHLYLDLSDAAHECVSDERGHCAECVAGGTSLRDC